MVKGCQDPDLRKGPAEPAGRMSLRSSQLQLISLGIMERWKIWSLGIKNACLGVDTCRRETFVQPPPEWGPSYTGRVWRDRAPDCGLNDAPAPRFDTRLGGDPGSVTL